MYPRQMPGIVRQHIFETRYSTCQHGSIYFRGDNIHSWANTTLILTWYDITLRKLCMFLSKASIYFNTRRLILKLLSFFAFSKKKKKNHINKYHFVSFPLFFSFSSLFTIFKFQHFLSHKLWVQIH